MNFQQQQQFQPQQARDGQNQRDGLTIMTLVQIGNNTNPYAVSSSNVDLRQNSGLYSGSEIDALPAVDAVDLPPLELSEEFITPITFPPSSLLPSEQYPASYGMATLPRLQTAPQQFAPMQQAGSSNTIENISFVKPNLGQSNVIPSGKDYIASNTAVVIDDKPKQIINTEKPPTIQEEKAEPVAAAAPDPHAREDKSTVGLRVLPKREGAPTTGFASLEEHWLSFEGLADRYTKSNIDLHDVKKSKGLSAADAEELKKIHGPNSLSPPPQTPWYILLGQQFTNLFMLLLIGAGSLSLITYLIDTTVQVNLYLAVNLFVLVTAMSVSTFMQERKNSKVMDQFKKMLPAGCSVIRDGQEKKVTAPELVPGDIVKVGLGDKVPADLRILYSADFKAECSSITGEPEPIRITSVACDLSVPGNEARCLSFSSSLAIEGTCIGVVIRTGDHTMIGQIAGQAAGTESKKTTLQIEIDHFVRFIALVAITMAAIIFLIGVARKKAVGVLDLLINGFLVIIIANIPQGLPATVMSLLTAVAHRLAQKNVLVKKLDCIETLGATTTIASDKTGTLTQNRMTVTAIWTEGEFMWGNFHESFRHFLTDPATAEGPAALGSTKRTSADRRARGSIDRRSKDSVDIRFTQPIVPVCGMQHLYLVASICNKATFDGPEPEVDWKSRSTIEVRAQNLTFLGSPSEIALLRWCELCMPSKPTREAYNNVFEIPFNSTTKVHLVVVTSETAPSNGGEQREHILLMKGAPERIVALCSTYWARGAERPVNEDFLDQFNAAYRRFGSGGQRVLGLCRKTFMAPAGTEFLAEKHNFPERDLCFIGLTAITDPPRENVPEAVQRCQTAGIRVAMVTGDHVLTACAIARQVNILPPDSAEDLPEVDLEAAKGLGLSPYVARFHSLDWAFVEGTMVDKLTPEDWHSLMDKHSLVFARVTPNHKFMIVEQCQLHEEIVAVTGDGVNDAPALKRAHIGVAMGKNGSEVAREAASIVLMDDNFASIVEAVEQGRLIFDNLMKTIAYTLTHLMPQISSVLLHLVFGFPTGLSSLQVMSVDLLTEVGPAVSLAYEGKESDIMSRPPRNAKKDRLVSYSLLWYSYACAGFIDCWGCLTSYLLTYRQNGIYAPDLLFAGDYHFLKTGTEVFCTLDGEHCFSVEEQVTIATTAAAAWYTTLIISQALHIWSVKARRISLWDQGFKNLVTVLGVTIECCLLILFVYVPGVQGIMGASPVGWVPWVTAVVTGSIVVTANETRKFLGRRYPKLAKFIIW